MEHQHGNNQGNHNDHKGYNPSHGHLGHDHHQMMITDFKKRFWISLVITLPILIMSEMIQKFFGFHLRFSGDKYILFGLSTVIFFYGGWPFLKGLWDELKVKNPGMMTLIAMAITVAYVYSSLTVFGLKGMDFFWELATLIDIMLIGHWVEMKSVLGASKSLELLVNMLPAEAHKMHHGQIHNVIVSELVPNDHILIKPGEKIPADGIVVSGDSYLNESMLTGESKPVKKTIHDKVIGGSINGNGSLEVKVLHTGKESYLSQVIEMVKQAQKSKSKMQNLSDRAAKWLTFIALGAGIATLTIWLAIGKDFAFALERMVTVMVISCPHALGLAVPLVVAISTSISAKQGLLIRNRTAFEESRKITTIVFDKTGTLTTGDFGVTGFRSVSTQFSNEEILRYAGALEINSEHPIGVGLIKKLNELNLEPYGAIEFRSITGKGVEAMVEKKQVKVVSPLYVKEQGLEIPTEAKDIKGETIVFVFIDNNLTGWVSLADKIRPESLTAIEEFKKHGIKVMMATGDNHSVAEAVSKKLKLDGYFAEVLPDQKVKIVKELQAKKEFVAMTGDGVNDAPALAQADVGIAVGSGTDIAAETADIILVNSNPKDILNLILFGKATYRKMIQNLIWATAYNSFSIPLAAGILYPIGIMMSPAIGAILMSLSTVIVAINANLLRGKMKQKTT
jgi:P-type Cu2+ transporter